MKLAAMPSTRIHCDLAGDRVIALCGRSISTPAWTTLLPIGDGERRSHLQVQVRDGDACLEWFTIAFPELSPNFGDGLKDQAAA